MATGELERSSSRTAAAGYVGLSRARDRPAAVADRRRSTRVLEFRTVVERIINKLRAVRAVAFPCDKREYLYQGPLDVASIMIGCETQQKHIHGHP